MGYPRTLRKGEGGGGVIQILSSEFWVKFWSPPLFGEFFCPVQKTIQMSSSFINIFFSMTLCPKSETFSARYQRIHNQEEMLYELMKWFSIAINYSQLISWYGLRWEYEYFPEYNALLIFINSFSLFLLEIYKLVSRHGGCFLSVTLSQPHLRKPFLAMSHIFLRYEK